MLTAIKRFRRRQQAIKQFNDDEIDDLPTFTPPASYIKLAQGKIVLESRTLEHEVNNEAAKIKDDAFTPSSKCVESKNMPDSTLTTLSDTNDTLATKRDKHQDLLEKRLADVETTLQNMQERFNSHCAATKKEVREQLENMNLYFNVKENKQMLACKDHKSLQLRFERQETLLRAMQQENKALLLRVRQYEHCLDDVMRKVVDAIVAEDNLRLEVSMLKSRVRDLEAQNAALTASPAKGRDEGYCTMSSGQPQPSNGHLEDLPEEPEQWLLPAEPCSTEMEDWSMSQEELVLNNLDDKQQQHPQVYLKQNQHKVHEDWVWNSQDFLNSTSVETDSVADGISQLLQQKIIYSEDEDVACTEFTDDFYKLVNIRSSSARSLYSYPENATDDEDDDENDEELRPSRDIDNPADDCDADDDDDDEDDDDDDDNTAHKLASPTPSEAGRAQLTSCSSSETDDNSRCLEVKPASDKTVGELEAQDDEHTYSVIAEVATPKESGSVKIATPNENISVNEVQRSENNMLKLGSSWQRCHGWRRVAHNTTVGALVSPKRETTLNCTSKFNYAQAMQKVPPTRIPTCITFPQQQQQQTQTQQTGVQVKTAQQALSNRKSKIPPPVPVRRSYSYAS